MLKCIFLLISIKLLIAFINCNKYLKITECTHDLKTKKKKKCSCTVDLFKISIF